MCRPSDWVRSPSASHRVVWSVSHRRPRQPSRDRAQPSPPRRSGDARPTLRRCSRRRASPRVWLPEGCGRPRVVPSPRRVCPPCAVSQLRPRTHGESVWLPRHPSEPALTPVPRLSERPRIGRVRAVPSPAAAEARLPPLCSPAVRAVHRDRRRPGPTAANSRGSARGVFQSIGHLSADGGDTFPKGVLLRLAVLRFAAGEVNRTRRVNAGTKRGGGRRCVQLNLGLG